MRLRVRRIILLAGLCLAGSGTVSALEIQSTTETGGQSFYEQGSFRLECWQEGNRIMSQSGLKAMTVGAALKGKTVSFRGPGGQGASVVLISFDHSLCVTTAE
jgi:hypothetical protein